MKKRIDFDPSSKKSRRKQRQSAEQARLSRRALRHEVLEARQLLDANSLTFVLDFVEREQVLTVDKSGNDVEPFDATIFGFAPGQEDIVATSVFDKVRDGFRGIPDAGEDILSPIPVGTELDIDLFIGDL